MTTNRSSETGTNHATQRAQIAASNASQTHQQYARCQSLTRSTHQVNLNLNRNHNHSIHQQQSNQHPTHSMNIDFRNMPIFNSNHNTHHQQQQQPTHSTNIDFRNMPIFNSNHNTHHQQQQQPTHSTNIDFRNMPIFNSNHNTHHQQQQQPTPLDFTTSPSFALHQQQQLDLSRMPAFDAQQQHQQMQLDFANMPNLQKDRNSLLHKHRVAELLHSLNEQNRVRLPRDINFRNIPYFDICNINTNHQVPILTTVLRNEQTQTVAAIRPQTEVEARERDRLRKQRERAAETDEQTERRRKADRQRKARRRAEFRAIATAEEIAEAKTAEAAQRRVSRAKEKEAAFLLDDDIDSFDEDIIDTLFVGAQTEECKYCSAKLWPNEVKGTKKKPTFGMCCKNGKFALHPLPQPPEELEKLWLDTHTPIGKYFHSFIRPLNCALAMSSMQCDQVVFKGGIQSFRVHGMIHHRIGSLAPKGNNAPGFAQIYILDQDEQLKRRMTLNGLTGEKGKYTQSAKTTLQILQNILMKKNHLIQQFRTAYEKCVDEHVPDYDLVLQKNVQNVPNRTYNLPTANEIAAILPISDGNAANRSIVISYRDKRLKRIDETSCVYEALQYVLFYPYGTPSYPQGVSFLDQSKKDVTQAEYYQYRLFTRQNEFNVLHRGGRLFQQWCVDMYAKVLQYKLNHTATHQKELRAEVYCDLEDYIEDEEVEFIGKKVILPASIAYTPRWYSEKYRDAMTIVGRYKKPDLFVTVTCNPYWEEIQNELLPAQTAADRPDLCSRVFKLKLNQLMADLTKNGVFGKAIAWMYTIEFQKRGLPHAHILLILHPEHKLRCADDYDKVVCAELPDPDKQPELFELVCKFMVHKPCGKRSGKPCMQNGWCHANFPKDFCCFTQTTDDSYPRYKRRSPNRGGFTAVVKIDYKDVEIDNRWIVPYNPYLLKKYKCHINVEVCSTIKAIKYLYKYIYKGHDKASYKFSQSNKKQMSRNEIERFYDGFYISASEACWKLFQFAMHDRNPSVEHLAVHLPNRQLVYYTPDKTVRDILQSEKASKTTLTEWMKTNQRETDRPLTDEQRRTDKDGELKPAATELTYWQFPEYYRWVAEDRRWQRRKNSVFSLGRMWRMGPMAGEQYYLRLLLVYVKGIKSWKELLTYDGQQYETFKEACKARGLLADDKEWHRCMRDAANFQTGTQLLSLFMTILVHCKVVDANKLWLKFKEDMGHDIKHAITQNYIHNNNNNTDNAELIQQMTEDLMLSKIAKRLTRYKRTLAEFGLPEPSNTEIVLQSDIIMERSYDAAECKQTATSNYELMTTEQKQFYDAVINAIYEPRKATHQYKVFFCNAIGGAGKTFVAETLLAYVRSKKDIAIAVAYSGIAALLLKGGRTLHSRFKLPIDLDQTSMAGIGPNDPEAYLIRQAKLIIWDEAPMANKLLLECLDRSFQEICHNNQPFGGKILVLSGDWRQTLPVCPKASRAQIVNSCINRSRLWQHVKQYQLTENIRVKKQEKEGKDVTKLKEFADTLRQIGDGTYPTLSDIGDDLIRVPQSWLANATTQEEFIHEVYPNLQTSYKDLNFVQGRAILTPLNATAQQINEKILELLPEQQLPAKRAIDTNQDKGEAYYTYREETMNAINPPNLPPFELNLKKHCIVMLLRNIDPANGACNGTRMKVIRFTDNVIEAQIITGPFKGQNYFIPRITLNTNHTSPIPFKRKQFPIKLSYAMTINKAQGQTLKFMGLFLPQPVFGHGQFYVAVGRVGSAEQLSICLVQGKAQGTFKGHKGMYTRNVVYREVFAANDQYADDIEMECKEEPDNNSADVTVPGRRSCTPLTEDNFSVHQNGYMQTQARSHGKEEMSD